MSNRIKYYFRPLAKKFNPLASALEYLGVQAIQDHSEASNETIHN